MLGNYCLGVELGHSETIIILTNGDRRFRSVTSFLSFFLPSFLPHRSVFSSCLSFSERNGKPKEGRECEGKGGKERRDKRKGEAKGKREKYSKEGKARTTEKQNRRTGRKGKKGKNGRTGREGEEREEGKERTKGRNGREGRERRKRKQGRKGERKTESDQAYEKARKQSQHKQHATAPKSKHAAEERRLARTQESIGMILFEASYLPPRPLPPLRLP